MFRFMRECGLDTWLDLHRWSVDHVEEFWSAIVEFGEVDFSKEATKVINQPGDMTTARFFEDGELSFPAHVLRHSGSRAAIVFRGENGVRTEISFDELRARVAEAAAGLRAAGVVKGDRVAAFLPNCPEAIIAMLGATSLGAIWSSCSPDFGINGVVDRFGQIRPKVLIAADGYFYNGKRFDSLDAVRGVLDRIDSIQTTVIVPFTGADFDVNGIRGGVFVGQTDVARCRT